MDNNEKNQKHNASFPIIHEINSKMQASVSPKRERKTELKMTEEEKEINRKILKNMSKKLNYVKNPRYRTTNKCLLYSNTIFKELLSPQNPFVIDPIIVTFRDYQMNCVYQIDLKLLNRRQLLMAFKYIPPISENFSIKQIIYPKKECSLIAPGMYAKLEVIFHATSLESFSDELTIITEDYAFKIQLRAIRDLPALTLENPMDCNKCLIGDQSSMVFRCRNNGGDAHFKIITVNEFASQTDYEIDHDNEVLEVGPFSIFPREFYLYKGMMIEIFVNFSPKIHGIIEKHLRICCDSKINLDYVIKGEGIVIDQQIQDLDGIPIDESIEKFENLFFEDTFPFVESTRVLRILNKSSVLVKYHWTFYDIYNQNKFSSMVNSYNFFTINPEQGVFQPNEELKFYIKFYPKSSKIFEQKLDLILEDIPFQAIKNYNPDTSHLTIRQRNNFTKGEPFMLAGNSPYPSYPIFSFNLKGKGKLPHLLVDNEFINMGDVYVDQTVKRVFIISNPKTGKINFKLKKIFQVINTRNIKINNFFQNSEFPDTSVFNIKKRKVDFSLLLDQNISVINGIILEDNANIQTESEEQNNTVDYLKIFSIPSNNTSDNCEIQKSNNSKNKGVLSKYNSNKKTANKLKKFNTKSRVSISYTSDITETKALVTEDSNFDIMMNQNMKFEIEFTAKSTGLFKSSIIFSPIDGDPLSIDVLANVKGGKIKLSAPCLDFGLFSVQAIQLLKFKIKNISPIPMRFLLKQSRFKNINFLNYIESGYLEEYEGIISSPPPRHKIETIYDLENENEIKCHHMKFDLYELKFSEISGILSINEEREITVSFCSPYPKVLQDTIEIMLEKSESCYINIHANCQEPQAFLDVTDITPKNIFVTVPINYRENIIRIINPSNLPIHYQWEEKVIKDDIHVSFKPSWGVVNPKSMSEIKFTAIYYKIKEVNDLIKCYIKELEIPLGIEIKGQVTGLDIQYEISDDTITQLFSSRMSDANSTASVVSVESSNKSGVKKNQINKIPNNIDKSMKSIEIKNMKVNKITTFCFLIKNLSGIISYYDIYVKNYTTILNTGLNTNTNTFSRKSSINSNNNTKNNFTINHQLLSNAHEEINFTSTKGLEFSKYKQDEKDAIFYLSNKKGIAIVIEPNSGKLEPHSEVLIKISIYNERVGDFNDELICDVKGLPSRIFPMNLKIRGNPLQISPFQPGINYHLDPPEMKVGSIIIKVNHIEKIFKILNTGSNILSVYWKVFDYLDILNPISTRNIYDVKISEGKDKKFSLNYKAVLPVEFIEENKNFEIYPNRCIINPKAVKEFIIKFKTKSPGMNSALIVGYPKFEDATPTVELSELAIKVDGMGIIPQLIVDKKKTFEDLYVYKFNVHSTGVTQKKSIILMNKEKINLKIKTEIEGPFKIVKSEPVSSTIGLNHFNINPNSNLQLVIKFLCPNPEDEIEWPMKVTIEKQGKLKIIFENEDSTEFNLIAVLMRPRISLNMTGNDSIESPNFINFGFVNCESSRRNTIYIKNETEVDTKWSINFVKYLPKKYYGHGTITLDEKEDIEQTDDPEVFHFNTTEGLISGPSVALINIPIGPALPVVYNEYNKKYNPVKIEVMFKVNFYLELF